MRTFTTRPRGSLPRGVAIAGLLVVGMAVAACSGPASDDADASDTPSTGAAETAASDGAEPASDGAEPASDDGFPVTELIAVVTHGGDGDAFWSVVQNGAEAAGEDLGIQVDYTSDGDPAAQSRLIDNAVAQGVDGIVVSMANPEALQASIEAAVAADIPVITINSGQDFSSDFGALAHVGQSEDIAGRGAGEQLVELGATNVLCIIQEASNIGLNQRCDGAAEEVDTVTNLQVDLNNPTDMQARIRGALQADPSIDGVLAAGASVGVAAAAAAEEAGSDATIGTFDLNGDVVELIADGGIAFAVDQQQYEQGYIPVVMLKLFVENANTLGGGQPILTGPGFVDSSNVEAVAEYAERGTR